MSSAFAMIDGLEAREKLLCHIDPVDDDAADEYARQRAFLHALKRFAPGATAWAVPNAAARSAWAAGRAKGEGLVAGAPDLTIAWNRGVAFVEFKGGRTYCDARQRAFLNRLHLAGHHVGVFRTAPRALDWLRGLGCPVAVTR